MIGVFNESVTGSPGWSSEW